MSDKQLKCIAICKYMYLGESVKSESVFKSHTTLWKWRVFYKRHDALSLHVIQTHASR